MSVTSQRMSLAEYLAYDDGTETLHELVNGKLVEMPPESNLNQRIASFLLAYFLQLGVPYDYLRTKIEIAVSGSRVSVRLPDLMLLSEELAAALEGASHSTVLMEMPPPCLIVEVVSPGQRNVDRDYRYKRSEYEARGVAEYWIVDPMAQRVTVLTWVNGLYEEATFEGETEIASALLTELGQADALTAAQVLLTSTSD